MPRKIQNIRQNFSRGVISPRLSARVDLEGFKNALAEADNWIISSQGGAVMREGMEFVGYPASNTKFRIFQFLRGGEISDVLLEISAGVIRFWIDDDNGNPVLYTDNITILADEDDGELLTDEDDGEFLSIGVVTANNPYTDADLDHIYFVNQDKYGIICAGNHPPFYITLRADGTILTEQFPQEKIPVYDYNDVNSPRLAALDGTWRISFPATWQVSGFAYQLIYNAVASGLIRFYSPTNDALNKQYMEEMLNASAAKQNLTLTFTVTPVADVDGAFDVAISGEGSGGRIAIYPVGGYGQQYIPYIPLSMPPVTQASDQDQKVEPVWSYPTWVLHNGKYYRCIRTHAKAADNEPGVGVEEELYWVDEGIAVPNGFTYQYPDGNNWADYSNGDLISPQNRGFPTVAAFHQQRLIFMANEDNPTAIYGSAIGKYQDFQAGVNDDEGWIYVLDSSDSPQIKWANSSDRLLIGTSSGEWQITAEVTITPTDIQASRQNAARSHLTRPVQIDREIFYVEQGNRKLRSTTYVRERFAYTSVNASILFEHLVSTNGITRLAVQHVPETLITMVTTDGKGVLLAYEPISQVVAATELTTDGEIYDTAAYFTVVNNRDYSFFATKRNNNWLLERMRYPCSKLCEGLTANGVVLMDSWVRGELPADGFIVGLEHLEGKQVGVLIDDAWQLELFTVDSGRIPTPFTGTNYAVGLVYTARLKTMEIEDNFQGTGLGTKRRWNELNTRLLNSALPKVYGQRDRDRTPAVPMNTAETLRSGLQDVEQNVVGYGDGAIIVEQDRPYSTHVVAFFGELQIEDA